MSRVFDQNTTRFFRFWAEVFAEDYAPNGEYRFRNPVPCYNDSGSLLGFAVLDQGFSNGPLYARVAARLDFPERLDIENGENYYLAASFEERGVGPVIEINAIFLSKTPQFTNEPIKVFEVG